VLLICAPRVLRLAGSRPSSVRPGRDRAPRWRHVAIRDEASADARIRRSLHEVSIYGCTRCSTRSVDHPACAETTAAA